MAYSIRAARPLGAVSSVLRNQGCRSYSQLSTSAGLATPASTVPRSYTRPIASFSTTSRRQKTPDEPPPTDFGALDVLGNTPIPSSSVDVCMSEGFQFNSGSKITDGSGAIVVSGEAFKWRPWILRGEKRLLNSKGQWDVPNESLGLLDLVWPRPDLLMLGLGPENRPISPELRRYISSLGIRLEVLDTRNAAAQFNLLARERGITDVAAALIPIGWREGIGASD